MRFLPASNSALLLELDDLAQTMAVYRHVAAQQLSGVTDLVPAARTLLVHFAPHALSAQAVVQQLRPLVQQALQMEQGSAVAPGRLVRIPVRYNGEDLADVAQLLGLSVAQVIARHSAQPYDAAFAGFAPGFVYLSGGANFQVPRRTSPRTKVPAGSVALGGSFSAVYPSASPGGWQLLGVTEVAMWDLQRAEPAYIQPGFQVQFVDATRHGAQVAVGAVADVADVVATAVDAQAAEPPSAALENFEEKTPLAQYQQAVAAIEIVNPGLQTLMQDEGRHGKAGLGISSSGALDIPAMHAANRLVGNPSAAPVLENLLGQLQLRSHGPSTVAITGAQLSMTLHSAQGRSWSVATHTPIALNDGDVLQLHTPSAGVRSYVAVRGGWHIAPVLDSCASDTLAQIGPAPLQAGQRIAVGGALARQRLSAVQLHDGGAAFELPRPGDEVVLDVVLGPRTDWFSVQALVTLSEQAWSVTPQSNRVGIRLQGAQPLERVRHDELPSEGTVAGAIQVPINGQPVVFLADHPLTGGYPVIGAIAHYHLPLAAQIPVGCRVRFRVVQAFVQAS